jgi:RHS repeat-associated protein
VQETHYDAWGLEIKELGYQYGGIKVNKYLYNGKEYNDHLGVNIYDYGARMYDPTIGRWNVVDPLADRREWVSPYNYVQNNPMLRIDPDGRLDDYFNRDGKYLGSDEVKTDFVRILDQKEWDANKTVGDDGTESILNETGGKISNVLSKSGISLDAARSVYSHYNDTGLPTVIGDNPKGSTASFRYSVSQGKVVEGSEHLVFNHSNLVRNEVSDRANEIKNVVAHEGFHYNEYKTVGTNNFHQRAGTDQGRSGIERRAVNAQVNHPTFSNTRKSFQNATISYGMRYGYVPPINTRKRD